MGPTTPRSLREGHRTWARTCRCAAFCLLDKGLVRRRGILVWPVYTDGTDRPSAFEHGHIADDGDVFVAYFSNRSATAALFASRTSAPPRRSGR